MSKDEKGSAAGEQSARREQETPQEQAQRNRDKADRLLRNSAKRDRGRW